MQIGSYPRQAERGAASAAEVSAMEARRPQDEGARRYAARCEARRSGPKGDTQIKE
uniref:Uncharacterized protein n=1 Tax=Klebsiella pneumoniae TaxID=573 RepID=A0A3G4RJ87_KLEPN|nr:hypothetical protein [Klebsiella pneumoniae]